MVDYEILIEMMIYGNGVVFVSQQRLNCEIMGYRKMQLLVFSHFMFDIMTITRKGCIEQGISLKNP